jgi:hypothetical protein
LGDLPGHEERCEVNPENQKECQFGCGKIVKANEMKLWSVEFHGRGSCVTHLKLQLKSKEDELVSAKQELQTVKEQLETSKRKIEQLEQERADETSGNGGAKRVKACHEDDLPASANRRWIWNPDAPITSADLHVTKRQNIDDELYDELIRTVTEKLQTFPKSAKERKELRVKLEQERFLDNVCVAKVGLIKNSRDIRIEEQAQNAEYRLDISVRDLKIIFI